VNLKALLYRLADPDGRVFRADEPAPSEETAREAAMQTVGLLCVGLSLYAQDHGGLLPPDPTTFREAVAPYVEDWGLAEAEKRAGRSLDFRLNPANAGKLLDALTGPPHAVLLYEGNYRQPRFDYGGKAIVGIADGFALEVTPEEAAALRWT
jgi:hypothetical protein